MAALKDKLRAYGQPWALRADSGELVAWLVADDAAASSVPGGAVIYTAAEVTKLATLPTEAVHKIHALKQRVGGSIRPAQAAR